MNGYRWQGLVWAGRLYLINGAIELLSKKQLRGGNFIVDKVPTLGETSAVSNARWIIGALCDGGLCW